MPKFTSELDKIKEFLTKNVRWYIFYEMNFSIVLTNYLHNYLKSMPSSKSKVFEFNHVTLQFFVTCDMHVLWIAEISRIPTSRHPGYFLWMFLINAASTCKHIFKKSITSNKLNVEQAYCNIRTNWLLFNHPLSLICKFFVIIDSGMCAFSLSQTTEISIVKGSSCCCISIQTVY